MNNPPFPPHPQYAQPPQEPGPGGIFDGARHRDELGRPLYGASPLDALVRFVRNYVNFHGRASRSEFWWMVFNTWVVMFALALLTGMARSAVRTLWYAPEYLDALVGVSALMWAVLILGIIVPWISLGWRRLQDVNIHGALYLLCLIPYLGGFAVLVMCMLPPATAGRRFDRSNR